MKRKKFLKLSALASTPLLLRGAPVLANTSTGNANLDNIANTAAGCGKILVIIQLNGGNDGLNTVIPKDQYAQLANVRSNILPTESTLLSLNNNPTTSLHPILTPLQNLYNNGKLMIVQGVSYPNPNFSHFRATDIWFSASNSNETWATGWLGRLLENQYPGFPIGYPNATMQDPLAIQIGSTQPLSLQGSQINMGYNVSTPSAITNVAANITDPAPNNDYGRELTFLRMMQQQSNAYTGRIQNAYNATQAASATYPTSNYLADQLKIVAKLINGGLTTPIYIVNHSESFDTHAYQVDAAGAPGGWHQYALNKLATAIAAFQQDLELMQKDDRVSGMTYSEFGRRIVSNGSLGTDHGTAAPVLFFGKNLNTEPSAVAGTSFPVPGMIGSSPLIPSNATVMKDWFCMAQPDIDAVFGNRNFQTLPIFKTTNILSTSGIDLIGEYYNGNTKLNFISYENNKIQSYELELSTDQQSFRKIETLIANGDTHEKSYNASYNYSAPHMYYRIKGIYKNANIAPLYSNIVHLKNTVTKNTISVYPNPVSNFNFTIQFNEKVETAFEVNIYNTIGALVYANYFPVPAGNKQAIKVHPLPVNTHYILKVNYNNKTEQAQLIFVNH